MTEAIGAALSIQSCFVWECSTAGPAQSAEKRESPKPRTDRRQMSDKISRSHILIPSGLPPSRRRPHLSPAPLDHCHEMNTPLLAGIAHRSSGKDVDPCPVLIVPEHVKFR